jgi:lipoprotein NlpD
MLAQTKSPAVVRQRPIQEVRQVRYVAESAPAMAMYPVNNKPSEWQWPAQGKISKAYSANSKGIDITNRLGEPILAARAGRVVYSGNGIQGYGNLIIIKHEQSYMTTYAHNSRVYVKSGQFVAKGQKIAEMGKSGTRQVKLYFQVRYRGRPVNPNTLL